jgi:hypothetical protein
MTEYNEEITDSLDAADTGESLGTFGSGIAESLDIYVPVFYTQTTMSKNLGNPFIINDPWEVWGDAYYTTPWGETLPAWSGDYTHYLDPHPWINIHTTDLFIQSVYLGDYFAPGPKIQRVYYNDDPWLSALMGAIDVVDGGNFLGIAYLPGA